MCGNKLLPDFNSVQAKIKVLEIFEFTSGEINCWSSN